MGHHGVSWCRLPAPRKDGDPKTLCEVGPHPSPSPAYGCSRSGEKKNRFPEASELLDGVWPPNSSTPQFPPLRFPGTPQFFGVTDSQAATIQPGPRRPERPRSGVFLLPPNSVSLFEGQSSRFRDNAAPGGVRLANAGESFTPDYTTPGTTPGRCCQSASNSSSAPSPVNPSLIRR